MRLARVGIGISFALALVATIAVAAMLWLLFTDPLRAVEVLQTGNLRLILQQVFEALAVAARAALDWL